MQESGRWDIQEHAGSGHRHIVVGPKHKEGEYYAYLGWRNGEQESFGTYKKRVTTDVLWGEKVLREHIPGYKPLAFAVPYSNYGQRFTNDPQIPDFFFSLVHRHFPVLIDGDYLDEGEHRPYEIKGRGGHGIGYRITQGPADSLPVLECRLRDFVLQTPIWHEYACLKSSGSSVPSVYSE
jgi:hypothetical protein